MRSVDDSIMGFLNRAKIEVVEFILDLRWSLGFRNREELEPEPEPGPVQERPERQVKEQREEEVVGEMKEAVVRKTEVRGTVLPVIETERTDPIVMDIQDSSEKPEPPKAKGGFGAVISNGKDESLVHWCDIYSDIRLLGPGPISELGEKRSVEPVIEYLKTVLASHPHAALERRFALFRVRRGKKVYRLILPVGKATKPIFMGKAKKEVQAEAQGYLTEEEMEAVSRELPLHLASLKENGNE
jgi:hypothetical protein